MFTRQVLAGEPIVVYGDGEQTRDMVYVADVAAANIAASRASLPASQDLDGHAYNIGTGLETSVNRLADLVSEAAGRARQTQHAPERQGDVRRSAVAPDKAVRELGWQPQTSLLEGLQLTVRSLD